MMDNAVIEAVDVTHRFKQARALDKLNIRVNRGSVYALLGLNGSGKTTFVKLLTGQVGVQEGRVQVFGQEITPTACSKVNRRVGYVPENKNMYSYMTGSQMLEFAAGFYKKADGGHGKYRFGKAVARCLELFDLPLNVRISRYSKGMKSQLALALALCGTPELLVLDEPTDGIDPVKRRQFFTILLELVGERETTVFMTTNNINDVEKIADHTGMIKDGRLYADGETESLVENSRKVRIAFGEAYEPDFESWPGVLRVEKENRSYLVHIGSGAPEVIERMRALPYAFLDVINLNLEDIFIGINGGRD